MCREVIYLFFFKQKTAYEMRISDWSSDVCSSDLRMAPLGRGSIINISSMALLQRLAAVRGRLSHCADQAAAAKWRSEERRVGKECVSTCRSRWSPFT